MRQPRRETYKEKKRRAGIERLTVRYKWFDEQNKKGQPNLITPKHAGEIKSLLEVKNLLYCLTSELFLILFPIFCPLSGKEEIG